MTLERFRELCMAFPETEERLSHGQPTFFAHGKRVFGMYLPNHHGARPALWIPAAPGIQEALITEEPDRFFKPPYVGPKGWIGVYIDVPTNEDEIAGFLEEAHKMVAPPPKRAKKAAKG